MSNMNNVGKGINVLSLFDGVSIGRLALDRAGFQVDNYFSSEIDKHAIQVTKSNWPETIHVGDVTKLNSSVFPKIDIMFAGFPCQSISNLGKGEGLEGKSGLFWEFVRLKDELKPTYWLVENVSGLKKAIDEITSVLGIEPIRINSSLMTAQKRDRLYWTNIPNITQPQDMGISLKDILEPGLPEQSILTPGRARWVCSEKGQQCFDKRYAVLNPVKANCLTARSDGSWNSNYVTRGEQITRLTPIEYERLQGMGFNKQEVEIEVCRQKAVEFVSAVEANPKFLEIVLNAGNDKYLEFVSVVKKSMLQNSLQIKSIALGNADITTPKQINKHNQQTESPMIVNIVEKSVQKLPPKFEGSFVTQSASIYSIEGKIMHLGEEELHQTDKQFTQRTYGKIVLNLFGTETMQNAKDVLSVLNMMEERTTFTTSSRLSFLDTEQMLTICYWFAKAATDGFIPTKTQKMSLSLNLLDGYTACIRTSERYKSIGNSWSVPIISHILSFIPQNTLTQEGESLNMELHQSNSLTQGIHKEAQNERIIKDIPN